MGCLLLPCISYWYCRSVFDGLWSSLHRLIHFTITYNSLVEHCILMIVFMTLRNLQGSWNLALPTCKGSMLNSPHPTQPLLQQAHCHNQSLFPHFRNFEVKGDQFEINYLARLAPQHSEKAVFKALIRHAGQEHKVVVKFTPTYCAAVGEKVFSPGFCRIYRWSGYSSCRLRVQLYVYLLHKSPQRV